MADDPVGAGRTRLALLGLLVAADAHGSISAAARSLGVTQPTASAGLRALERRLGLDLLVRGPRGTQLTETGRVVAAWAREVIDASDRFEESVASLRVHARERLRVAASMTIAEYLAPRWLAVLARQHSGQPAPDVELVVRNSREVMDLLLAGDADLGFVEGPGVRHGLRHRTVAHDELVAVVGPDHPWAHRRSVTVPALLAGGLVVREAGSGTREVFEDALARAGQHLPEHLPSLGSTAAVKAAVLQGGSVAVLSALAVADDVARGTLVRVPVAGLELGRRLRVVWKDGVPLPPVARRLAAIAAGQDTVTGPRTRST